jgi:hypothetical protein
MKPVTGISTFGNTGPPWKLSILDSNDIQMQNALNDMNTYSNYLADVSGVVNSVSVSIPTGLTFSATPGARLEVKVAITNTGPVTLTISGVGSFPVTNQSKAALSAGVLIGGGIYTFQFDGTNFQVVSGITISSAGLYNATFQSGAVQVAGPNGSFNGFGNFQWGFQFPNASGIPSQGILVGGAGATQVVHITDQQLSGQKGITVIFEAGDGNPVPGTDGGGDLLHFAGGSINGPGGRSAYQGGTSVNGIAGDAELDGGNATGNASTAQAGNAIVSSGQVGQKVGIGVILSANTPPGALGTAVIRHQFGRTSTVLSIDEFPDGSLFLYDIPAKPARNGFGLAGQPLVSGGPGNPTSWQTGFTGTITTAKLTPGGANGSMTFSSGILISQVQAT